MTAGRKNVATLSKDWCTPPKYVASVRQIFGGAIDLDPCSNRWSVVDAKTSWTLPHTDGLGKNWDFPTIYVNPPYGSDRERGTRISDWLAKCARAFEEFNSEVIALVPVAANTLHWKESVWARASGVCFLYDTRLRFLENGKDTGKGAPMACACVYWGRFFDKFAGAFSVHGAVVDLSSVRLPSINKAPQLPLISAFRSNIVTARVAPEAGLQERRRASEPVSAGGQSETPRLASG